MFWEYIFFVVIVSLIVMTSVGFGYRLGTRKFVYDKVLQESIKEEKDTSGGW